MCKYREDIIPAEAQGQFSPIKNLESKTELKHGTDNGYQGA